MVAVCAADNQLTVWDLSVERDGEEEAAAVAASAHKEAEPPSPEDLPAQLMSEENIITSSHHSIHSIHDKIT
jgi:hypothetical protein